MSQEIGTGHFMRCLTLADELATRGMKILFLCRDLESVFQALLLEKGHSFVLLNGIRSNLSCHSKVVHADTAHSHWLNATQEQDAQDCAHVLRDQLWDWLIVDHYAIDTRWEQALRPYVFRIMVIDDLADRSHDCDLLLDQNLGSKANDYDHLIPMGSAKFIGPKYALLRPEFGALRTYSLTRRRQAKFRRMLISLGGVDKGNTTSLVLETLENCRLPEEVSISVVMGSNAPWLAQVQERASRLPWPTEVIINVKNMAQLMAESDFAIGAVGVSAWERCCLGLPTLAIVIADNQRSGATALEAAGCIVCVADPDVVTLELPDGLTRLFKGGYAMQQLASELTEGAGASLLASQLEVGCDRSH